MFWRKSNDFEGCSCVLSWDNTMFLSSEQLNKVLKISDETLLHQRIQTFSSSPSFPLKLIKFLAALTLLSTHKIFLCLLTSLAEFCTYCPFCGWYMVFSSIFSSWRHAALFYLPRSSDCPPHLMSGIIIIFFLSHTFNANCMMKSWLVFIEHLDLKIHSYTYFQ